VYPQTRESGGDDLHYKKKELFFKNFNLRKILMPRGEPQGTFSVAGNLTHGRLLRLKRLGRIDGPLFLLSNNSTRKFTREGCSRKKQQQTKGGGEGERLGGPY